MERHSVSGCRGQIEMRLIPHLIDTENEWYNLSRKSGGKIMAQHISQGSLITVIPTWKSGDQSISGTPCSMPQNMSAFGMNPLPHTSLKNGQKANITMLHYPMPQRIFKVQPYLKCHLAIHSKIFILGLDF